MKSIDKTTALWIKSLLILSIFFTCLTHAKVYKWTDENGKVHYSDKPFNQESKELEIKKQPNKQEIRKAKQRTSSFLKHQSKKRSVEEENENERKLSTKKKEAAKRKLTHLCKQARREKINLSRGFRSYIKKENGDRHFLSDAEKENKIEILRQKIKENCPDEN